MPDDFQVACKRAQDRVGERTWWQMTSHEQAEAIYREMRAMDAEHRTTRPPVISGAGCQ
jgi:hypothetical protein